jgi:hypothetical protein
MNERKLLQQKAQFYLINSKAVHIDLNNERFYNGYITYIGSDFLELNDFKIGGTFIFFLEIKNIEPYLEKNEKKIYN